MASISKARLSRFLLTLAAAGAALAPGGGGAAAGTTRDRDLPAREARAVPAPRVGRSAASVRFEPNLGQWDPRVRFLGRGPGCLLFLADGEAVFRLGGPGHLETFGGRLPGPPSALRSEPGGDLRMAFVGASPAPRIEPAGLRSSVSNYFLGNEKSRWRSGVPHFGEAAYRDLWPGVDLVFRGEGTRLEYDVVLAPGADLDAARFRFSGAKSIALEGDGTLVLGTAKGEVRQSAPRLWQEEGGLRREVAGGFRLLADGTVGFEAGRYDRTRTLVVDPVVSYATYLGGSGNDWPNSAVVDSTGNVIVAGYTTSTDFPLQSPYQATYIGATVGTTANDAFVTKYAPDGQSFVFSTYFGGNGFDDCNGVAVDPSDDLVFCGGTNSTDFPTASPIQAANAGGNFDMYFVKMNPAGNSLLAATYYGTTTEEAAYGIACNATGIYLVGATNSALFVTKSPAQPGFNGAVDAVVMRLNLAGTTVNYATMYGGTGTDLAYGIAVDSGGAMFVAGETSSTDFPVQGAIQSNFGGRSGANSDPGDGFCLKLVAGGQSVAYATYIGASSDDYCRWIAVDPQGDACLAGFTTSGGFPTLNALQPTYGGGTQDAWCAKINPQGSAFLFSTFFGGSGVEYVRGVGTDSSGNVTFCGLTSSGDFPVQHAFQTQYLGGSPINNDGFAVRLNAAGSKVLYATYFGSAGADDPGCMAMDLTGSPVIAGVTDSNAFPLVNPHQGSIAGGSYDCYVLRIALASPSAPTGFTATLQAAGSIQCAWTDTSSNEDNFEVERKVGAGPFVKIATTPFNSTIYLDAAIAPSTTYTYRVRAVNTDGASDYSNESGLTTNALIPPPTSPNGLTATPVTVGRIDLAWNDRSNNETLFEVQRRVVPGDFAFLANVGANGTAYSDTSLAADTTVRYRVRAVGVTSPSAFTNEVLTATPPTLTLGVTKAAITDSASAGKDKVKVKGTYIILPASPDMAVNPVVEGVTILVGSEEQPAGITIGPGDGGWKVSKSGKATWRSPKGSAVKAVVVLDLVKRTYSFSISKINFPGPAANPMRISMRVGNDAGTHRATWTAAKKIGVFSYKGP